MPVPNDTPPTAVLIGEGLLPLRCAEMLVAHGFAVVGVISSTSELAAWADARRIAHIDGAAAIGGLLRRQPFDLLFSIVNGRVLDADALSRPRIGAVNFHNALLPRLAGSNASSWAILEGEEVHGVTWHMMTPRVDAGAILVQARLAIEPTDTAQSLNLKCYELGLATFTELLANLPRLMQAPITQDASRRTFYAASRKPADAGIISWRSSAEAIQRLVRACTVSPESNRLASPVFAVGEEFYIASRLDRVAARSTREPGTVVDMADGLRLATLTEDVVVRALRTLDGESLDPQTLAAGAGLSNGCRLPEVDRDSLAAIAQAVQRNAPSETFWLSRLESFVPLCLRVGSPSPVQRSTAAVGPGLSLENRTRLECPFEDVDDLSNALSVLLVCLARAANVWSFDVGFSDGRDGRQGFWSSRFFAPYLPFRCEIEPSWTVAQCAVHVYECLRQLSERGGFSRDLGARYARLRAGARPRAWALPIVVTVDGGNARESWRDTQLAIDISIARKRTIWSFDPQALPTDLVQGLARSYAALIHASRTSPAESVSDLPAIADDERQHLLVELNAPRGSGSLQRTALVSRDACLHELFEEQVRRTPDAVAVALHRGGDAMTYRELNQRANQLAHALRQLGVGRDTPVALILDRSLYLVVSVVAVLKAGGAYVPLDPAWPGQRLKLLLDDLDPRVVLTERALAARLSLTRTVLCVAEIDPLVAGQPRSDPEQRSSATDLAAVMFTSGSTGQPKGVAVPHRAIVRLVSGDDGVPWTDGLTVLQLASVTFDAAFLELWGPLLHGGTCVVYTPRLPDLQEVGAALRAHRVSCLWLTASLFNLVIDEKPQILRGVRYLLTGGEALSVRHVRRALAELPDTRLINGYGPTEATTFTCCYPIPRVLPADLQSVPIGRPLVETRVYVLDDRRRLVPKGMAGELYIGGDGVARGYWNRPQLTAEFFLPDPFAADPHARMYRSGDRCRWLPEGNLEFLGRVDDQIKLRGFRVEPGEIEAVLARHAAVRQCAVVAQPVAGEMHLVGYVVPRAEDPSSKELRRYLADCLPEYMVPSTFVCLGALPLSSSGKIDRSRLPALPARSAGDVDAAATQEEVGIAAVWQSVLGHSQVGLDDNFFDLGGTSLALIQAHSRLTDELRLELSVTDLFEHPTIRSLARRVSRSADALADGVAQRALRQRRAFEMQRRLRQ